MSYDECDSYVSKINNIYGNMSFAIPTTNGAFTSLEITAAYLAKIRQDDIELYGFITRMLNNGEGIEAKEYSKLEIFTDNGPQRFLIQIFCDKFRRNAFTFTIQRILLWVSNVCRMIDFQIHCKGCLKYSKLETLKLEIMKEGATYVVVLEGKKTLTTYNIDTTII